jgi:pilus assembly protein CpaC
MEVRIYRKDKGLVVTILLLLSLIIVALHSSQTCAKTYEEVLEIYVGQTEILSHRGVSRVSIGSGDLASVKVLRDAGQILLIGKKTGLTDLRVWMRNKLQKHYLLRILDQPPEVAMEQVRKHLADIEGVSIKLVGDQVVIEGSSLRKSDQLRVEAVSKQFPNVTSYVTDGGITLHGMIHMDVKVVEVKKNELKKIGIDWADIINGPQYAAINDYVTNSVFRPVPGIDITNPGSLPLDVGSSNPYFGIATNLTSIINLMANDGNARMLAEPQLTCRSGGKAEFLAGGEVPLPIRNNDGSVSVTFKQYGIILKIEPESDPDGYISTHVSVEISTVDDSIKVLDIPGFLTRKTDTDMNVRQGETMVISGLVNTESAKAVDKLPGLGNIPILGELFKSRSFKNNETEMVILVTPHIIDPEHKINKQWIKRASELREQSSEDLEFKLLD